MWWTPRRAYTPPLVFPWDGYNPLMHAPGFMLVILFIKEKTVLLTWPSNLNTFFILFITLLVPSGSWLGSSSHSLTYYKHQNRILSLKTFFRSQIRHFSSPQWLTWKKYRKHKKRGGDGVNSFDKGYQFCRIYGTNLSMAHILRVVCFDKDNNIHVWRSNNKLTTFLIGCNLWIIQHVTYH